LFETIKNGGRGMKESIPSSFFPIPFIFIDHQNEGERSKGKIFLLHPLS